MSPYIPFFYSLVIKSNIYLFVYKHFAGWWFGYLVDMFSLATLLSTLRVVYIKVYIRNEHKNIYLYVMQRRRDGAAAAATNKSSFIKHGHVVVGSLNC